MKARPRVATRYSRFPRRPRAARSMVTDGGRTEVPLNGDERAMLTAFFDAQRDTLDEEGSKTLAELFDGRSQLLICHIMFGPSWTAAGSITRSLPDLSIGTRAQD